MLFLYKKLEIESILFSMLIGLLEEETLALLFLIILIVLVINPPISWFKQLMID